MVQPEETRALGAFYDGHGTPRTGASALRDALASLDRPVSVVDTPAGPAVGSGGRIALGQRARGGGFPLLAWAPSLTPDKLGSASFRAAHGARYALVGGAMANAIASEEYVEALAGAGMLAFFGSAGPDLARIEAAIDRLKQLGDSPYGFNLIHSPSEPELEAGTVELFLRRGIRRVSASAYLDLTLPVVRYRVAGIREEGGRIVAPNQILAKVSRAEVARRFLAPPPERFLRELVASGDITEEQARLAGRIPMAEDITAEADSGGHTDNRPLVVLLPELLALRDTLQAEHGYAEAPRVGAAGGIATPGSAAAAFALGAAYVVTGSINQSCLEAGTSDLVRELLAQAGPADVAMAPAADMFEMGVEVQVLGRGTMFPVRARKLYELYKAHGSLEEIAAEDRASLESTIFRQPLDAAWADCAAFWQERDPAQLERAAQDPKHRMALLFRAYLGQASRWANAGVAERRLDFQIWCGPSMGGFNRWVEGTELADWRKRDVVTVSRNLLAGAAHLARAGALRTQGLAVPAEAEQVVARSKAELSRSFSRWEQAEPATLVEATAEDAARPSSSASRRTADDPIAIVGMGCTFPKAPDLESFWRMLRLGLDAVDDIPEGHWTLADFQDPDPKSPDRTYATRGAFLDEVAFDPTEFGIPPSILEATDTSQLLALWVAKQALRDAGYPVDGDWDRSRASVILGVTGTQELVINLGARLGHPRWWRALRDAGVDEETAQQVVDGISRSYVGWQESSFPGLLGNVVAGRIANRFDFGGTNCVLDAACASSLAALHLGCMELQRGRADVVLTGGVDTLNDIFMHMCFSKTPALSPTGDVRPFAADADGTILGEGLGMVVLKRLADAEAAGDRIYAVIRGVGTASDGRAKSIYAPLASGQARALRDAYRDAGVSPRDIQLLEAHGTGTKAGDVTEFEGLREVFGEASDELGWCALGSVKAQIGHTKAAAGSAGLIKAALALHHKVLPGTLKVTAPNPKMKLETSSFHLPAESRPWLPTGPRRAGVSSFGFGGSDYHVVLEEYRDARDEPAWDGSVEIWPLSGDVSAISAALGAVDGTSHGARLARAAFDRRASHRLVLLGGRDELSSIAKRAQTQLAKGSAEAWSIPGAHFGIGDEPGQLAFVFSGQGSQYLGMGRELASVFDAVSDAFAAQPEVAADVLPPSTFDQAEAAAREARLRSTDRTQPALGAFGAGLLDLLAQFGVKAELAAGHSYGELLALHAAGRIGREGLYAASTLRGRLMADEGPDHGGMLAVLAPLAQVEDFLTDTGLALVLANRNAPEQAVLSGAKDELERAVAACQQRGLRCKRLDVGAAFHSPLVADAQHAFEDGLAELAVHPGRFPVWADATAEPYPEDGDAARALLASQLARPVRWVELVEGMADAGATTFVEVGPKAALTGLIGRILAERPHRAIALDASGGRRALRDLADVLALLASQGRPVDLASWQAAAPPPRLAHELPRTPRMVVPLTGANLRPKPGPQPVVRAPRDIGAFASPPSPSMNTARRAPEAPMADSNRDPALLLQALTAAQSQLEALQAMQRQTAEIHQQFLAGQAHAQATFQALVSGQQSLLSQAMGGAPVELPAIAAPPVPTFVAPTPAFVAPAPAFVPPTAPAASAPAPVAVTAASSVPVADRIVPLLLQVVAESTGYPTDMLELDMDLESDLGIDSIKRVEILSLFTERMPEAPAVEPEQLGRLHTLRQVAEFVGAGVQAPVAPAAPPVAAAPALDAEPVLLQVVSELTGYPQEMLDLDLDLESDLGIDSIKRVEILSLLTERLPGAPAVEPERLGSLHSLRQVLDFLGSSSPATSPAVPAAEVVVADDPTPVLLQVVSELTGYPEEMLDLDLDLESDLGIDSIKRVEILSLLSERLPGVPTVEPEQLGGLHSLRQVLGFLAAPSAPSAPIAAAEAPAPAPAPTPTVERRALVPRLAGALPERPARLPALEGPVWIVDDGTALCRALAEAFGALGHSTKLVERSENNGGLPEGPCGALVLTPATTSPSSLPWTDGAERALTDAFALVRALAGRLRSAGESGGALLLAITRQGGDFGVAGGFGDPLQGGLAGLVKTVGHEWPEVRAQVVDVHPELDPSRAADAILGCLELDRVEVGLRPEGLAVLELEERPAPTSLRELPDGGLVVVTGGARGVTAACTLALAEAAGPLHFLLLGRSPLPADEADWLREAADEAGVKRALLAHGFPDGRPSPKALGEACRRALGGREIRASLAALEAAGSRATYRSVDVRDAGAVSAVVETLRSESGPVVGVVHGAGVLRDRRIEEKSAADFAAVFDTKVAGLRSLLASLGDDVPHFFGLFTSVSGRFGRRGQVDYAMANEVLAKVGARLAANWPSTRVVALDWGPWEGGMVNSALAAQFKREGVGLIPLREGALHFVSEVLADPSEPVELVVGSGLDLPADAPVLHRTQVTIDPEAWGVLNDHRLGGKPVLPAALALELLAEAALERSPGASLLAVEDLRVLRGVVVDEPVNLTVELGERGSSGPHRRFEAQLLDEAGLPRYRAAITVGPRATPPPPVDRPANLDESELSAEEAYRSRLFHGPALRTLQDIEAVGETGLVATLSGAPSRGDWLGSEGAWALDPLLLDGVFQAVIVWCWEQLGSPSLPSRIERLLVFADTWPGSVEARVAVRSARAGGVICDVDLVGDDGVLVARLEGYRASSSPSLVAAFGLEETPPVAPAAAAR